MAILSAGSWPREWVDGFAKAATYFNAFAGNAVSAAAGMAVLDVPDQEALLDKALSVGAYVMDGLVRLAARHDNMADVRGTGLFFAAELAATDRATRSPARAQARQVVNAMREAGVLISRIGIDDNVLKMRSPLVFSPTDADLIILTLDDVLRTL